MSNEQKENKKESRKKEQQRAAFERRRHVSNVRKRETDTRQNIPGLFALERGVHLPRAV